MSESGPANPGPSKRIKLSHRAILALAISFAVILIVIIAAIFVEGDSPSKSVTSANSASNSSKSTNSELVLKDLGVKFKTTGALAGVSYKAVDTTSSSATKVPPMVKLYKDSYSQLANQCLGNTTDADLPFATLIKIDGKPPTSSTAVVLKQFDTFYVVQLGGVINVHTKCVDDNAQKNINAAMESLDSSLKTAFQNAEKSN